MSPYPKGGRHKKQMSPDNPARVVILVGETLSRPVLYFYQVSSKFCEGHSSYRADTKSKSNTRRGHNRKSKKVRVVILIHAISCGLKSVR